MSQTSKEDNDARTLVVFVIVCILVVFLVFMCYLESKDSGSDPNYITNMFRVKLFGYDYPRTILRVLEKDPNVGQIEEKSGAQSTLPDWHLVAFASRNWLKAHCLKYFMRQNWKLPPQRPATSHVWLPSFNVTFDMSNSPTKYWSILENFECVDNCF